MIDWLRRDYAAPTLAIGACTLPIAIRRNHRARRLTLRLAPDGTEIRVTMPSWGRTADALAFAQANAQWLSRQLENIPPAVPPQAGGALDYRGSSLTIAWLPDHPRRPRVHGDSIELGGPESSLVPRLRRWLESEALRLFESDLADFCPKAGVALPSLRLSRAQRRWGSCAANGTVRLNWRLVQAPDFVRRSVVAHEIAHLVHFDHGPAFHSLLAELFEGDLDAANGWLKREGRTLYTRFG